MKIGDVVYVSNPDTDYEKEFGIREHRNFFGEVTEVTRYKNGECCVEVDFGYGSIWAYHEEELDYASSLKHMTLEEFSNKFGLVVNAEYI